MPELYAIPAGPALGPVYIQQEKRENYAHVVGETCSLTDRVIQDTTSKQRLDFQLHHWQAANVRLVDYMYSNPVGLSPGSDYRVVLREYRKMIKEHMERRILFFFQQLIVCYQTKLHFESFGAQDQAQSAEAIHFQIPTPYGIYGNNVQRQAAHSSSNPCLVAFDNTQWQMYLAQQQMYPGYSIPKPQGFVFLKDTDYYRTVNATMNMPRWVNDADREVDELKNSSLLRSKGNDIINHASEGFITPDQGMFMFIQAALYEVQAARQRLARTGEKLEVQEVLGYYEKYLTKFQKTIGSDPTFLEKFLNLIRNNTQDDRSKQIILQMRYAAIRNCQLNQSTLIQKVEALRELILKPLRLANGGDKPANFDAAFRSVVVEHARTDENRKRMEKLLNFSLFNFEAQLQRAQRTMYFNTKRDIYTYSAYIDWYVRDILEDMRKMRTQEMYDRAQTVKELRGMKGWTQKKLGQEIRQIFPFAAASQSTISKIENRGKLVTERVAMEFSRVFGVDPGLFMPHFYYE